MSGRQRSCRCASCGMVFPDEQKLRLHKQKYCGNSNLRESARRLVQQKALPEVADEEFKQKMRELVSTQRVHDVKLTPDSSKTYSTRSSYSYYCSTCCSTCSSETEYMQPAPAPAPVAVVDSSMDENIRLARWKIRMLQIMHQQRIQELEHNQKHLEAQRSHLLRHIKALSNERVHDKLNLHELTHALEDRDVAFKSEIDVIRNDIANFGASEHNTGDILLDLLNEIDDLRILYLRSGGNDPSILSELNLLRSQIMKLQMVRKDRKHHHKHDSMAAHKLAALREQNERLERELIELSREAQNPPVQQTMMMPGPSAVPVPMYDNAFLLSQIQDVRNQIGALLATRAPIPVAAPVAPMNLPMWNPALHKPANYTEWWRGPLPAGATPTFGAKPYYPTK